MTDILWYALWWISYHVHTCMHLGALQFQTYPFMGTCDKKVENLRKQSSLGMVFSKTNESFLQLVHALVQWHHPFIEVSFTTQISPMYLDNQLRVQTFQFHLLFVFCTSNSLLHKRTNNWKRHMYSMINFPLLHSGHVSAVEQLSLEQWQLTFQKVNTKPVYCNLLLNRRKKRIARSRNTPLKVQNFYLF